MLNIIKRIIKKIHKSNVQNQLDPFMKLEQKGLIIGESTKSRMHSPNGLDDLYPWLIEIGNNCIISSGVRILAHDASAKTSTGYTKLGLVSIGDNVFIGHGSTVLCGVSIGNNSIIGANSLVSKDIPSDCVYAGNPAHFICTVSEYKQKRQNEIARVPIFKHKWKYWRDEASMEERQMMKDSLQSIKIGYIKSGD